MSSDNGRAMEASAPDVDTENHLTEMWMQSMEEIRAIQPDQENWKIQALPLARIKKIMKSEEFVMQELEKERLAQQEGHMADEKPFVKFMISAEAPLLMSKACELLIRELSSRAWQHTERNRRRTLQRQDVHAAVGESEVFDFLIDIVPRVAGAAMPEPAPMTNANIAMPGGINPALGQAGGADMSQQLQDPLQGNQFNSFLYQQMPGMEQNDPTVAHHLGVMQQQQMQQQQQQQQPQPPQQQQQQQQQQLLQQQAAQQQPMPPQGQHQQQQQLPPWNDPQV